MTIKSKLIHCFFVAGLFLSGCQNTSKTTVTVTEKPDADLVMMPGFGGRPAKGSAFGLKPMTLEELTACGKSLVAMNQASAQLQALSKKLDARKSDIARQVESLEAERSQVDVRSRQKVADFNHRLEQNRGVISQYNAELDSYNSKVNAVSLQGNQFNTGCANRAYRSSDADKLPADLLAAMRNNSSTTDIPLLEDSLPSPTDSDAGVHLPASSGKH